MWDPGGVEAIRPGLVRIVRHGSDGVTEETSMEGVNGLAIYKSSIER